MIAETFKGFSDEIQGVPEEFRRRFLDLIEFQGIICMSFLRITDGFRRATMSL